MGTSSGLNRYKDGKFTLYTTKQGLSNDYVHTVHVDKDDNLWVGTENGLNLYKNGEFIVYTTKHGLSSNSIRVIYANKGGSIWIGTWNSGLNLFKDGEFTVYTEKQGLFNKKITAICENKEGSIWVGTEGGGLYLLKNNEFTQFNNNQGLSNNDISAVYEDKQGNLWVGTKNGLNLYRDGKFTNYATTNQRLYKDSVRAIYEDNEGNLWVGVSGNGLYLYKDGKFITYTEKEGVSNNVIKTIYESRDGKLWIGTPVGLNLFKNGKFTVYTKKEGLSNDIVTTIYEDNQENLWVGTRDGLNLYKDDNFTVFTIKNGLSSNQVRVIYADKQSNLWIGTSDGLNLYKDGKFIDYTTKMRLSSTKLRFIHEDNQGRLWIGTSGGINLYKDNKFTSYTINEGLSNNSVWSIYEDEKGNIWIGSSGGLHLYKDGKFTIYTTKQGLFNDVAWVIMEDGKHNLWMSCNKGVYKVKKQELLDFAEGKTNLITSISFGVADGMRSRECNGGKPAGWKTKDGKMYFPTIKGMVAIDPDNIKINNLPPPVQLEKVIADRKLIDLKKDIQFAPSIDKLEFHYAGLSYVATQKVLFMYMLKGFDKDWVAAGTRKTAYYTNLSHGEYHFIVKDCNNDGVWNETGASFSFKKLPYFYETYWFFFLNILAVILLGTVGYFLNMNRVKARQKQLEKFNVKLKVKVETSTLELRKQKEELVKANKDLGVLADIGHKITSSLDMEQILESVYNNAQQLLPVERFLIVFYDNTKDEIDFKLIIEKGKRLHGLKVKLDEEKSAASWAIRNKKPIIINNKEKDYLKYGIFKLKIITGELPHSLIYYPLILKGKVVGLISVQSFIPNAYTDRHLEIVKTIANYTLAAIENSDSFEKLKELDKQKTHFFQNISHELRTPLTLLINPLVETVIEQPENKHLQMASKNAHRLLRLVNQLLDFQKIAAGKKELNLKPLNLVQFINSCADYFKSACKKKKINFSVTINEKDISDGLFNKDGTIRIIDEILILTEVDALEKIIFNLLSNALKFTPESGYINLILVIDRTNKGKFAQISIKDSGKGIAKKDQDNLFKIFSQVDESTTREFEGSGLGLALVKELTEAMKGTVEIDSNLGKGSTFKVIFPIIDSIKPILDLLIICDKIDYDVFDNAVKHIKNKQITSYIDEAENILSKYSIRCLLTEYKLENTDGIEFCSQVADLQPACHRFLYMDTSKANKIILELLIEQVMHGTVNLVINKPLNPRIDVELLEKSIESSPVVTADSTEIVFKDWHLEDLSVKTKEPALDITEISSYKNLILIIDDLEDMRVLISNMLISKQYSVITANNGEIGFKKAKEYKPQLIIVDWMMPVLSGPEMIKKLKADKELLSIPVILLTAKSDEESRTIGTKIGADGFLGKPFNKVELFSMVKNMLQLKAKELELVNTQNKLVQAEKLASLGVLSAGLSHEINNPNNFISMSSNLLLDNVKDIEGVIKVLEDSKETEELTEFLKTNIISTKELITQITNGSQRINEVVTGLKSFSYQSDTKKTEININEVIDNTISVLHFMIKDHCTININLFEPMPKSNCDEGAVKQVFIHIIRNAIQSIQENKAGVIDISTGTTNGKIKAVITDNGVGINIDNSSKIFDPFFTTRDVGEGLGLGLTFSHNIISAYNGNINIKSEKGKGTKVIITIPYLVITPMI